MKSIAILAVVGILAATLLVGFQSSSDEMEIMYQNYINEYGKTYNNAHEYEMRFNIFKSNVEWINAHNLEEGHTYEVGINQFSDWTNEEYRRLLGYKADPIPYKCDGPLIKDQKPTGTSKDWVADGAVNKVQNQGSCGSCWSFGTVGAIEGAHFIATGQLLKFSEQEFVDCCHDSCSGCNGGFQNRALIWAETNKLCTESEYTYTAKAGTCQQSKCTHQGPSYCQTIQDSQPNSLFYALEKVPVSLTVDAGSSVFQSYKSGVLNSKSCTTYLNHAVLGVGFGVDPTGGQFVKIKNSWGASWGENGYIRVSTSTASTPYGYCGIFMDNSIAVASN